MTQVAALLSPNLGVFMLSVIAIYLNFRLPPLYRVRGWVLAGGILSAFILAVAFAGSAYGLLQKFGLI